MKRIFKVILMVLFTCFSFYYTDRIVEFSKSKDPIMQKINEYKENEEIALVNGVLSKDTMLVGSNGYSIDVDSSYEKMKKLNSFNANLLEYLEVVPEIRKEDNLDKLIEGKNTSSKIISFIFVIEDIAKLDEIAYILENNNVFATFFMDGVLIENNLKTINTYFNSGNSLGLYGYNFKYDSVSIKYINGVIERNITNYSNYCLYKNKEFLDSCVYLKYNTIQPIDIDKNLYEYMKNNKKNGYIYNIKVNDLNIRELNSTIVYLKQKGYDIVDLSVLLKE